MGSADVSYSVQVPGYCNALALMHLLIGRSPLISSIRALSGIGSSGSSCARHLLLAAALANRWDKR